MGFHLPEMLRSFGGMVSQAAWKLGRAAGDATGLEPEQGPALRDLKRPGEPAPSQSLDALLRRRLRTRSRRLWTREDGFTMSGPGI